MNLMTERNLEKAVNDKMNAQGNAIKMQGKDVTVHYGDKQALFGVSLDVPEKMVTALIGPFGLRQVHFPAQPQPHE